MWVSRVRRWRRAGAAVMDLTSDEDRAPTHSARWHGISAWLASEHASTVQIDIALILVLVVTVLTRAVILGFHVIFVLLAFAALMLPFRRFAIRLVLWMTVSTLLVVWAVIWLSTPSAELTELPMLMIVVVLVFLVAQARGRAAKESEAVHVELERRAALEREVLQHQLEDAQRRELIGRASAGLAHDLRNVFVAIRGCADEAAFEAASVAIDEEHDSAASTATTLHGSWLDDVSSASTRGLAMIDDLLWLGRQNDHENRVSDLGVVLPQIEPLLRRLVRRGITFHMDIPPTDTIVRIDRVGLTQVLMNLVANASDAIESEGSITVSSRQTLTASPGDPTLTTSIVVSDTGCGFSQEAMERAFEPDFTTKDGDHGGYGLATVWQIVDRCGGTVQVDSAPGGATVSIRFGCSTPPRPGDERAVPADRVGQPPPAGPPDRMIESAI